MYSKVYVEITNICNKSCSFCHGHNRPLRQMSASEFELILSKLKKHTEYIYYHLMGEPLTHPQLCEFVGMAGKKGFKSVITTNGTLLPNRGAELIKAGVHKVNISVHSFEGGDGEYVRYVSGLADFAIRASQEGVIVVFRFWNKGFDDGKNELALNVLKLSISGEWINNNRGIKARDNVFVEFADRFEWPDTNASKKGNRFYCYGLKSHFGILVDGTIVPCCLDSDGIINLGNIYHDEIDDVLRSKRATDMVEGFKQGKASEELCTKCGYAQRFVR